MNIFLSILSGFLLPLAFPKFNLYWIAWVALMPFFLALRRSPSWRQMLICGAAFGITYFGFSFIWVSSLFRFAGWWILLGWICLTLFEAIFVLLFVLAFKMVIIFSEAKELKGKFFVAEFLLVFAGAFFWVVFEWLRGLGPLGLTFGDMGYSQVALLPLIQIASFSSIYGVSFLVVAFNISLAFFLEKRRSWLSLAFVLLLIFSSLIYGFGALKGTAADQLPTRKIVIVQPNVDQKDKLDLDNILPIFELHEKMTRQTFKDCPQVILWPESAVFDYLLYKPLLLKKVKQIAIDANAWFVLGAPHYIRGKAYNSMFAVSPSGKISYRYDKHQLVPFGEYLPFPDLLYPILKGIGYYDSQFSIPPYNPAFEIGELKVAAVMCFESLFPQLVKERAGSNTQFILLLTNDSWFDYSSVPEAHLNCAIFRAIENRQYFIQVGNTGFSAVIDPFGRILKKSKLNQQEILLFDLPVDI